MRMHMRIFLGGLATEVAMPDGNELRRSYDEAAPRRATNVTLNTDLVERARKWGVNVSRACEAGLAEAVAQAEAAHWKEENREALDYAKRFVEERGVPFARHRRF